jgi:hypothetical protein
MYLYDYTIHNHVFCSAGADDYHGRRVAGGDQ